MFHEIGWPLFSQPAKFWDDSLKMRCRLRDPLKDEIAARQR
jgi:hypothetical protein